MPATILEEKAKRLSAVHEQAVKCLDLVQDCALLETDDCSIDDYRKEVAETFIALSELRHSAKTHILYVPQQVTEAAAKLLIHVASFSEDTHCYLKPVNCVPMLKTNEALLSAMITALREEFTWVISKLQASTQ